MKPFVLSILLFLPVPAQAQKGTMLGATEQCWSGGIAGRHGCNYTFSISFAGGEPVPDTIWIGDDPIPIRHHTGDGNDNTTIVHKGRATKLTIRAGTSHDDYAERYAPYPDAIPKPHPVAPIKYQGVALLSYTSNGKRRYFTIPHITERLPHISYP